MVVVYFYGCNEKEEIRWYGVNVSENNVLKKAEAEFLKKAKAAAARTFIPTNPEEEENSSKRKGIELDDEYEVLYSVKRPVGRFGLRIKPSVISHGLPNIQNSSCLAVGPFIYCVGGGGGGQEVHRLDTSHPESESSGSWESCTPMNVARESPQMAAIDGKLFVFMGLDLGGGDSNSENNNINTAIKWGEYLDPSTNKWEFLPPIPVEYQVSSNCPIGFIPPYNQIVVMRSNRDVLCLDVKDWSWTCMECGSREEEDHMTGTQTRVLDWKPTVALWTLYWFCLADMSVYAYDLLGKRWFSGRLKNFKRQGNLGLVPTPTPTPTLLHIRGGLFCLVWVDRRLHAQTKLFQIRCTKLKIHKRECPRLQVVVHSTQTYLVDSFNYLDALIVQRCKTKINKKKSSQN